MGLHPYCFAHFANPSILYTKTFGVGAEKTHVQSGALPEISGPAPSRKLTSPRWQPAIREGDCMEVFRH